MAERTWIWLTMVAVVCASSPAARGQEEPFDSLRKRFADRPLRWGGDAEGGAPFQLRDPNDPERVIGFEVELVDSICQSLSRQWSQPVEAEFVQYEWVSLPLGLEKHDFDIIVSGFEITPENSQGVLFSRPYYIYAQQLVVRSEEQQIKGLPDCRGRAVGTLAGSAAERILSALPAGRIVAFDGQVEPYLDLAQKRLDAVLLDSPIAAYYAGSNPKLKFVGDPVEPGKYGVAFRNDDVALKEAVDRALSELMQNGRMQQIYRKWRLWNADQAALGMPPKEAEELQGLGFDAAGRPLPTSQLAVEEVDLNIVGASAQQWTFSQYAPLLLRAAGMTVYLTFTSMAVAMALGLVVSLCRLYGAPPLRWLALMYVEFFRGIPLLLLLFFLYFGLASFGFDLAARNTAILAFGLNYAAYEAEIYRSAISAVPVGQWEAGRALGMSESLTFRRIIFPQAFRTALGPMTNDVVALFKDTSLVSVIAVRELTKEYLILSRSSLKFVELGLLTAALYLLMSVPLGYLSRYLERRWGGGRVI